MRPVSQVFKSILISIHPVTKNTGTDEKLSGGVIPKEINHFPYILVFLSRGIRTARATKPLGKFGFICVSVLGSF